jgi:hypothetical protein
MQLREHVVVAEVPWAIRVDQLATPGCLPTDGEQGGPAGGLELEAAAAVAVEAVADLLEVLGTGLRPAASSFGDEFVPCDVSGVANAVTADVGGGLLAAGDAGVGVRCRESLRPGNGMGLLLFVVGGEVPAQRDPHLGPDAALVVGGCLLEPFPELAVEKPRRSLSFPALSIISDILQVCYDIG